MPIVSFKLKFETAAQRNTEMSSSNCLEAAVKKIIKTKLENTKKSFRLKNVFFTHIDKNKKFVQLSILFI